MSSKRPLDLRVADWLLRRLKIYKEKRNNQLAKNKWSHLFKGKPYFTHQSANGPKMLLYKDSLLSGYIYNGFEQTEIAFIQKVLQPGDTFIDIGANIGLFALYAAKITGPSGKVFAFEPTPLIYKRLMENVNINAFTNLHAVNIGLSESPGMLKLYISKTGKDGWNSFAKNADGYLNASIDVPVDTLDNFIAQKNVDTTKIRFIKIDVEGWEIPVIKGALNTINAHDGIILMVEFTESNSKAAGYDMGDLYDLVVAQGYTWYVYDEQQNKLIHDPKRLSYPYTNLFAVKDIAVVNNRLATL